MTMSTYSYDYMQLWNSFYEVTRRAVDCSFMNYIRTKAYRSASLPIEEVIRHSIWDFVASHSADDAVSAHLYTSVAKLRIKYDT
jgi:hypothetical protein